MPFNRPTTRSGISGNWRAHAATGVRNGNEDADTKCLNDNRTLQNLQKSHPSPASDNSANFGANASHNVALRGEDDPLTLQAIAEGRRLYVGNLPYMANTQDIMDFFRFEYQV